MISLYKTGDTHEVKGVKCVVGRFHNKELEAKLSDGWKKSPEETVKKVSAAVKEVMLTNDQVRDRAKSAGLEDWETGRIQNLAKKLGLC